MDKHLLEWKANKDKEIKAWEEKQVEEKQEANASVGTTIFLIVYLIFFIAMLLNA